MNSPSFSFRYALDEWPPPLTTALLSLQWLVALLPGLLVLGDVLATAQGLDAAGRVEFLQRLLLVAGVVQVAQTVAGHRLPGLVGPSAVLLVGILGTLEAGVEATYTAVALGGVFTALAGASGLAARLSRLYTPPVLASALMLLIVALAPTIRDALFNPGPGEGSPLAAFGFGLGLVCAMFWAQERLKGILSSAVLLLGMVLGSLLYYLLGLGSPPLEPLNLASGLSLPDMLPGSFAWDAGVVAAICLCNLALIANEIASVEAITPLIAVSDGGRRSERGVLISGLSGILGGLTGTPGMVTYSVSPGVLLSSRCASRWTLLPAAVVVLLLAVWPQGLALVRLAPPPVVGAVLLALMASTVYAALHLLVGGVCALSLSGGLVVGAAITAGLVVTFMPPEVRASLPPLLRPLLANGFVVGLALALVLEHLVLGGQPPPAAGSSSS